jgi:hypothetical protein
MGVQEGRRAAKLVEVGVFSGHSITTSARPRSVRWAGDAEGLDE